MDVLDLAIKIVFGGCVLYLALLFWNDRHNRKKAANPHRYQDFLIEDLEHPINTQGQELIRFYNDVKRGDWAGETQSELEQRRDSIANTHTARDYLEAPEVLIGGDIEEALRFLEVRREYLRDKKSGSSQGSVHVERG